MHRGYPWMVSCVQPLILQSTFVCASFGDLPVASPGAVDLMLICQGETCYAQR